MPAVVALLRPSHWIKNLVVLAPLVFAGLLGAPGAVALSLATFAAFCLLASAVYAFNDWRDAPRDRHHPAKRTRPLADGRLGAAPALLAGAVCLAAGLALAAWIDASAARAVMPPAGATGPASSGRGLESFGVLDWSCLYVALNALYTLALRHVAVLDVLCLAVGFALRPLAGAAALRLAPSRWLVVCCASLALFLAAGKRRLEVGRLAAGVEHTRPALLRSSPAALHRAVLGSGLLTIATYVLYTVSADTVAKVGSRALLVTVPMVVWGVARFARRIGDGRGSDPVGIVLTDRPLQLAAALWLAAALLVVYGPW